MVNRGDLRRINTIHCVNLAQGIKEPVIYYQQEPDKVYLDAVNVLSVIFASFTVSPRNVWR